MNPFLCMDAEHYIVYGSKLRYCGSCHTPKHSSIATATTYHRSEKPNQNTTQHNNTTQQWCVCLKVFETPSCSLDSGPGSLDSRTSFWPTNEPSHYQACRLSRQWKPIHNKGGCIIEVESFNDPLFQQKTPNGNLF
jgi:hypothetical protein